VYLGDLVKAIHGILRNNSLPLGFAPAETGGFLMAISTYFPDTDARWNNLKRNLLQLGETLTENVRPFN